MEGIRARSAHDDTCEEKDVFEDMHDGEYGLQLLKQRSRIVEDLTSRVRLLELFQGEYLVICATLIENGREGMSIEGGWFYHVTGESCVGNRQYMHLMICSSSYSVLS
jgi:hypothetical protein